MTAREHHVVVVGGGITGLAAGHRLVAAEREGLRVTLLEGSERLGGWIRTETFAGRPVDFGPDSLLVRTPWARQLAEQSGIGGEMVAPGRGGALLLIGGELRSLPPGILAGLPGGPMPFVRSGLLGPLGIARAALDLVLPASGPAPGVDESIGALVRRRLGPQALERVIDPLLGGVHAGRCDELSVAVTAPQIAAAARADRSLVRGLRRSGPPRPQTQPGGAQPAPAPVFMAPRGGMQPLVEAVAAGLAGAGAVDVRTGARASALEAMGDGRTRVLLGRGDAPLEADAVVLAVPARPAAALLAPHAPVAALRLRELRFASIAQVAMAFDPADVPPLPDATGFLVPRPERRLMTACTFLDVKWPERRAVGDPSDPLHGAVVIKCSVGRSDDLRHRELSDDEIVRRLTAELHELLGISGEPLASRVARVDRGLPQFAPGHLDRIRQVEADVASVLPGVRLAGASYHGSSVPLCVRDGFAAADAELARLR